MTDQALLNTLVDISESAAAQQGRADLMLDRACWAASVFDRYDRASTMSIVEAVAEAAHAHAGELAQSAVTESGFGVVAHKKIKNELTAHTLVDHYRDADYVNPRIDEERKIVEIPRPAGVVFALIPSTNPVATINFKVILSLMTRNAIVISPHPAVRETSVKAVQVLGKAAEAAGAPAGVVQILHDPSIPLVEAFMSSDKTSVILATGGAPMVRAAYASGNPAIGVGPGNTPVFVDESADLNAAAQQIVTSKSFDNSVLCTNESVLITLERVAEPLKRALQAARAYICSHEDTETLRRFLFHDQGFNVEAIGRDATWIAKECRISAPPETKILVTPITQIGLEERLSQEKLCPVLALHVCRTRPQALAQARAVLRLSGAGHSAAVHASDEDIIMAYASSVEAYRVVVNAPSSQGASGFATNLAPTFTVGTGFFGRSSIGDNIGPQHLVHWTRIAYATDAPFGNYHGRNREFRGALPKAPADGVPGSPSPHVAPVSTTAPSIDPAMREQLRRLISQELREFLKT